MKRFFLGFFGTAFLLSLCIALSSCNEEILDLPEIEKPEVIKGTVTEPYDYYTDGLIIDITERQGIERQSEYVSFGVPLSRSMNIFDASQLTVTNSTDEPLPAQFEVLARWGGTLDDTSNPAKWVLAGFFSDLPAGGYERYKMKTGEIEASFTDIISVDETRDNKLIIDTGPAQFTILKDHNFNLFDQVIVNNRDIILPLKPEEAICYKPAGSLSLVMGDIQGLSSRMTDVMVEREGPLYLVLKGRGSIVDAQGKPLLDYTVRYHFYAGDTKVKIDFTVENNHPIIEAEHGQPGNVHEVGAVNSVYIGSLSLNLRLLDNSSVHAYTEDGVDVVLQNGSLRLYQDSSGAHSWDNYVGMVGWPGEEISAAPRIQSFCELPGYVISGVNMEKEIHGQQATGWIAASAESSGAAISVAFRDFWQNFPKALEVYPDGTISIDLFPNGEQFYHNLRVGEAKTHSVLFEFKDGDFNPDAAYQTAQAFSNPLWAITPPEWNTLSGVLGPVPVRNTEAWSSYENYVNQAFEPNPDFDISEHGEGFGNRTLLQVIDDYGFYGWQDYGDVPLDYESFGPKQAGQMNLKYWFTYGMFMQMLRSGDERWYELALPAAWHLADIDHLHIPDSGIEHWSHGAYFGHSQHDEPGNINPNRNYNSPSVDLFFGPADLLLAYYVTGNQRFAEVAMEGLQAMENLSQFSNFADPIPHRSRANLIFAYIEGYRYTGDQRWMDALRHVVGETAKTDNKPWLNDPGKYRPGGDDQWLSSFSLSQVMWTMGRYLDFLDEYNLPDDLGVADALVVYAGFFLEHNMVEYRSGRAATYNAFWFFDPGWGEYLEINNWALVTADALAYAYRYSGEERFFDAAVLFYETGITDPQWEDALPEYIDTKGLVNHLNWGLVYMYEALAK